MLRKLTARYVETVRADSDRLEIRDAAERGLELRVTPSGVKSWALRYRRKSDGAKRNVTLGAFPDYSLEEARGWAADLKRQIARGDDPASGVKARKEALTFSELAAEWIKRHGEPDITERALADCRSMLRLHIEPEIGTMKANEVRKRDIIALLDAVAAKADARSEGGESERRMTHRPNRVFELVRAILKWAVGRDMLQANPTDGVKPPIKREAARERVLSNAEIKKLWAALEAAPFEPRRLPKGSPRGTRVVGKKEIKMTRLTALAVQLALATGQRIGEVVGAKLSEFSLNDTAPLWEIPGSRTKNGEPNRVPLSPLALEIVRGGFAIGDLLYPETAFLFPGVRTPAENDDRHVDAHAPTKAWERSRKALGMADVRIHDLRRTAATGMAELGVSPHTVSLVLNHISVRRGTITGRVYDRYEYDREKREALAKWGAHLKKIVRGRDVANVVALHRHN